MTKVNEAEPVQHLHGTLYRVKADLIKVADIELDATNGEFHNPRCTLIDGVPTGRGLSKVEMDELREAIRTEGLQNPPTLRGKSNLGSSPLIVLNGERRFRCITKLRKDNAQCFDPADGTYKPARELYDYIDARILINIDDKTAYKHAFSGNERAVDIGEGATVALIRQWRKFGWKDEDIMTITGKSITWLRDTDLLISLDETSFNALHSEEINRTVALQLAKVKDVKDRHGRLAEARRFANERMLSLQQKVEKDLDYLNEQNELTKAQITEAEIIGNKQLKARATEAAKTLAAKLEEKTAEAEELNTKTAKVTSKDLDKANVACKTGEDKRLTYAKGAKLWIPALEQIIASGGKDEEGTDLNISVDDAKLVYSIWMDGIEKGERDILKLLQAHQKTKK